LLSFATSSRCPPIGSTLSIVWKGNRNGSPMPMSSGLAGSEIPPVGDVEQVDDLALDQEALRVHAPEVDHEDALERGGDPLQVVALDDEKPAPCSAVKSPMACVGSSTR
jgi:hypothetical protein